MNAALLRRLKRLTARLAARLAEEALPAGLEARLTELLDEWERLSPAPARDNADASAAPVDESPPPALHASSPIRVWCDGSCAPNPGPGGWAAILEQDGRRREISGAAPASTNNIMEMTAAIEALRLTPDGAQVHVTTDSRYLMDGITRWLPGWKRKHWRKSDGKPVLNQPLWMALEALVQARRVRWEWVEGHSGHAENERVDALANAARREA